MKMRGVEATVIGKFTHDGKCTVKYQKNIVLNMEMEFLHNGRPVKQQYTRSVPIHRPTRKPINRHTTNADILKLLQSPNLASTEFVTQQYDHEVQASSVLKPLQGRGKINSDAAVIK